MPVCLWITALKATSLTTGWQCHWLTWTGMLQYSPGRFPLTNQKGQLEFNCSCFLYAGNFRFRLEQKHNLGMSNKSANLVVGVQFFMCTGPTFIWLCIGGSNNQSSNDFKIGVYTNDNFHPCPSSKASTLFLDVSYLEQVQVGRNTLRRCRPDNTRY